MGTELVQQQNLRQEQTMTHQQIQALELLVAPITELQGIISGELDKNPVLEVEPEERESIEIERKDESSSDSEQRDDRDEWIEKLIDLDGHRNFNNGTSTWNSDKDRERSHFFNSLTEEECLDDALIRQLGYSDINEELRDLCETVISCLDEGGYLKAHPADIAMISGAPTELIEQAINTIKSLEPAGIGAINLQERLLLQLTREGLGDTRAYEAVRDHLEDIAANRLPKVARAMKMDMESLQLIILEIQNLSPYLPSSRSISPSDYVQEEVEITESNEELEVHVRSRRLPSLRISNHYKQLLQQPDLDKDTREYIKNKINGGIYLINSLMQRQSTIERISRIIATEQRDFFLKGVQFLRPLTMAQVAETAEVHETTVSRAVSSKFLRCKYGLFPLKYFFTPGFTDDEGNTVSNTAVKKKISEFINQEDGRKPLSDSQISKMLEQTGLAVARRTVAKYRENLNILPSNLRRQY